MKRIYTDEVIEKVKELYPKTTNQVLSKMLNINENKLKNLAQRLGIQKNKEIRYGQMIRPKALSSEQEAFFTEHYPNTTNADLAKKMGLKITTIKNAATRLNLKKSEAHNAIHIKRFTTEHKTWNKGVKGIIFPGSEKGWFKKGHQPHNTKEDGEGSISYRFHKKSNLGYFYIRKALGVWHELHRHLWEQANGTIPKGYNICYIDNNSLNCCIENLQILSNRELAHRNINIYNNKIKTPERLSDEQVFSRLQRIKLVKSLSLDFQECQSQGLIEAFREILILKQQSKSIKNAHATA